MQGFSNIKQLVTCACADLQDDIGLIENGALVWDNGKIVWVGKQHDLPDELKSARLEPAPGALVIPGLVDCHTHLAFGGWRANEFALRIEGKTYLEIAQSGGGILSTVKKTREATEDELVERCKGFLREISALGVTTVECKSGYGLSFDDEMKQLRVYKRLAAEQPLTIVATFLGAHTFPPEYKENRQGYMQILLEKMIPHVGKEKLAQYCDVFVEKSAFSFDEGRAVLECARRHGLGTKIHADQLSDGNGAELAALTGAASADHLEYISERGIQAMKSAGVVAVTLPLATLYTFQKALEAQKLIKAGVPVAVATDFNPGSAPSYHLPMTMSLACVVNRMTPAQVLKGATRYAARAIGLESSLGSLEPGKRADIAVIDAPDVATWLYNIRGNACVRCIKNGAVLQGRGLH